MEIYLLKQPTTLENENRVRRPSAFRLAILFCAWSLALFGVGRPATLSDAKLGHLIARSDLIVVAQTQTICGSCRSEGPYPDGTHRTPEYREFIFPLTVNHVLKGVPVPSSPWFVAYTALVYRPKDPPVAITGRFTWKVDPQKNVKERPLEGAPTPGISYVFFLQNRKQREPGSYEAAGGQEIIYDNFDFDFGMLPDRGDLVARIRALAGTN